MRITQNVSHADHANIMNHVDIVKNVEVLEQDIIAIKRNKFSVVPFSSNRKTRGRFLLVTEKNFSIFETLLIDLLYEDSPLQDFSIKSLSSFLFER